MIEFEQFEKFEHSDSFHNYWMRNVTNYADCIFMYPSKITAIFIDISSISPFKCTKIAFTETPWSRQSKQSWSRGHVTCDKITVLFKNKKKVKIEDAHWYYWSVWIQQTNGWVYVYYRYSDHILDGTQAVTSSFCFQFHRLFDNEFYREK